MQRIFATVLFIACLVLSDGSRSSARTSQAAGNTNQCVQCHERLSAPVEINSRFLDWRASRHAAAGVTCDRCHGGDAAAREASNAHSGMFRSSDRKSRLCEQNAPQTCGECHRAVVSVFVESEHYRVLKTSGLGPSCTSCHAHMGSSVARPAREGESLCTFCHNTVNGLLPQRPDIVKQAKSTLDAFSRTSYMIGWINDLIEQAEKRKLDVSNEKEDLNALRIDLAAAKSGWHAFSLEGSQTEARKSFEESVKIQKRLTDKLGRD